jgi:hypothetical protein
MKNKLQPPDKYRDDRMYVMRMCSDFTKLKDGTISVSMTNEEPFDTSGPIMLITYRNTYNLPAFRTDEFKSYAEAIIYIHRIEPTCPRLSLGSKSPNPIPTWEAHLDWLHSQGLKSAVEGDFPMSDLVPAGDNPREIFQIKEK